MLTKPYKYLHKKWVTGKINILATARRMGYKGASLTKGIRRVRMLLTEMGITVM